MAHIVIAQEAGACYGVNRALKMVEAAAEEHPNQVMTLGPLIHNPAVVSALEERGVSVATTPEDAAGKVLILRTHGVTPEEEARARRTCAEVLDATCPFVVRAHRAAERLVKDGYQVIVVGEAGHPEVEGTLGHAPGAIAIAGPEELKDLNLSRRVGVVVQTTQSRTNLTAVIDALIGHVDELDLVDTICEATSSRQLAAQELARRADLMIVIGGRNSANTRRLAQICSKTGAETHHVENVREINSAWFSGRGVIGITAGASTPQGQIEEVRARIASLCEAQR